MSCAQQFNSMLTKGSVLKVYALPLLEYIQNKHIFPATPRLITAYSRPKTQGIIQGLSIYNSVVVATLVHWPQTGALNPSYSLLFLNLVTGITRVVDHLLPEVNSDLLLICTSSADPDTKRQNTDDVRVYVCPWHVAITSFIDQASASVHVYCLPSSILQPRHALDSTIQASGSTSTNQTDSLGPLVAQYHLPLPLMHDYRISGGLHHPRKLYLSLFAQAGSEGSTRNRKILLHNLCLSLPKPDCSSCSSCPFLPIHITPTWLPGNHGTSAPVVCVGITGRRGVWLERNWDREEVRLMRLSHTAAGSVAGVLVPPHPALPFTPATCHSLAFDEVTGRLCVGLETGELYVLDY